jgi:hypothetical protein
MHSRLFVAGLLIWLGATAYLRLDGQRLLHPGPWWGTLLLFAISFPLMASLARRLCKRFQLSQEQWAAGAVSLVLPTLLLDPISSAFFCRVFPNIAPGLAGIFGGWMLCCCAGVLVGAIVGQPRRP